MFEVHDASIRFGGLIAVRDVSLTMRPGEILGLVGPNGAGKSTLLNILTGNLVPDAGRILLDGVDISGQPPHRRVAAGLARSFQTPRVDPFVTVREALRAACYLMLTTGMHGAVLGLPRQRSDERRIESAVEELLAEFALLAAADEQASTLPISKLRLLEAARIAALHPSYAFLDEPAAGLDEKEQDLLKQHLRRLVDTGTGVLLVEHNFSFICSLADRVSVLSNGRELAHGTPQEIRNDADVVSAYLGDVEIPVL